MSKIYFHEWKDPCNDNEQMQDYKNDNHTKAKMNYEPTTVVKTYVKDNIRYWIESTTSGIIVSFSTKNI